jgi:hypothetical protein
MGLADIIRAGVAIAATVTRDLQAEVFHTAWIGQNGAGDDQFASPVTRHALVDRTRKPYFTKGGNLISIVATITFLDPIPDTAALSGQQRVNPIDPRDIIMLDDGVTAPIVRTGGFEDAGTKQPFVNEVALGN